MSELINNREHRKQVLKEIILELHAGKPVHEVKAKFDATVGGLDAGELSLIEQSLINEGLPIEEVQRLCDVHSAVFKDVLDKNQSVEAIPGHPIHTFMSENRAIEKLIQEEIKPLLAEIRTSGPAGDPALVGSLVDKLNLLWDVEKHYSRKENLLFPYLEHYGITAPPKVMWGVDDEIRSALKELKKRAVDYQGGKQDLLAAADDLLERITEMIFKEEKILFPMALETLTEAEWYRILRDSDEIGFCLVEPSGEWKPARESVMDDTELLDSNRTKGAIRFSTGVLTSGELELIFRHLPVDITFVDKNDVVKYFSATKDRIFARTRTIIGRKVENCHPPASVHIVEKLVNEFKAGTKDEEAFWIHLGGKYVHIRYFAVRNDAGEYLGTLEVTQDIGPLQAITGEKRIMD